MDPQEPVDIRDFLPPGAEALGVDEPGQTDMTIPVFVLQMIGQREVQLFLLNQQIVTLRDAVVRLSKRPRTVESDTQFRSIPPEPMPESPSQM